MSQLRSRRNTNMKGPRPSRSRYQDFRRDYRQGRVDDGPDHGGAPRVGNALQGNAVGDALQGVPGGQPSKRREYVREYLRWLWPHRFAVSIVFVLALVTASLQMIEPLFIRFIIDRVLLNTTLDAAARLTRLNTAGALYFVMIATNSLLGVLK